MRRFGCILFCMLIFTGSLCAQPAQRRIRIDSVVVTGHRPGVSYDTTVGTKISTVGLQVLQGNQTKSLSELLSNNSMVYIKSLGQGALATSSFRGTSSGHTQVNWNGIRINPNMSNSFDFSQIPVFFADNVTLYHGNSHLKGGTGALGGSINIANTADWADTTRVRAFAEYGSYQTYTGAASIRFVLPRAIYQTRLYYQQSENNYRYLNKVLTSLETFEERRKDARYKLGGVMQEAYFRSGRNGMFSVNAWFQGSDRMLPQPIIVNSVEHEQQQDWNLRSLVGYEFTRGKHELSAKIAYLLSTLSYEKWQDSEYFPEHKKSFNRSQSLSFVGDYTYLHSPKFRLNASLRYSYDFVSATNYSNGLVTRNTLSLMANALWKANGWLSLSGQVMGEMNDSDCAPTFSAGVSARLAPKLEAKANAAYNYKFPSLNDLYWQPGGNPGLKPEHGFSYDLTLSYTPRLNEVLYLKTEATYYLMNIDNWIMWLPTQNWYWEPRNVQNVLSHGLELMTEMTWMPGAWTLKLGVSYTYSPSINRQRNFEEDNTYHKQLPYVPLHKANARLRVDFRGLFFTYQTHYIGQRFTSADQSYSTNAYTIHDAEIGYDMKICKRYKLTPKLRMDNLFDAYYESTQYYPMPLRNISGSVTFTF